MATTLPLFLLTLLLLLHLTFSATTPDLSTLSHMQKKKRCLVYSENKWLVKIRATARGISGGWRMAGPKNNKHLIYKPWKKAETIDGPGGSVITYNFKVTHPGHYRFVMRSNPAKSTEHNDVFVKFGGMGGMRIRKKWEKKMIQKSGWTKVYNNRKNAWGFQTSTVDNNPHIIITPYLKKNKWYQVAISGRSSLYKISTLYLFHCKPGKPKTCNSNGSAYKYAVSKNRPFSQCS